VEFYDNRYDFSPGNECTEVLELLNMWGLDNLSEFAINFFDNPQSKHFRFNDFNVSNIIYSQMYTMFGYESTNKYFCNLLGIDDFVILNSFDNVYISAETLNGTVLDDEGKIVEFKNGDDRITHLNYMIDYPTVGLNQKAISAIKSADLIIISTGTFWSSILPTIEYLDFYKYINKSNAKKVWAINNEFDNDSYGVTSNDFIRIMENVGLDVSQFTILENSDAIAPLREPNDSYKIVEMSMGNIDGKHIGKKYATAIFKIYYNLIEKYDKIIFDFDDTIWSRDERNDLINKSIENLKLINCCFGEKAIIISGNSYSSIQSKLFKVFGTDLKELNINIWADANSTLYVGNDVVDFISELSIGDKYIYIKKYLSDIFDINSTINSSSRPVCLKIKPLKSKERLLLNAYLNDYLFEKLDMGHCKAICTGTTTIDILHKLNNKKIILEQKFNANERILYIGDEVDCGNDYEISHMCDTFIHTSGVVETNLLIKLLGEI
jgi:hypothetical protein